MELQLVPLATGQSGGDLFRSRLSFGQSRVDKGKLIVPVLDLRGQKGADTERNLKNLRALLPEENMGDTEPSVRGFVLVSEQDSHDQALELARRGFLVIETDGTEDPRQLINAYIKRRGLVERQLRSGVLALVPPQRVRRATSIAATSTQNNSEDESPYAREPAYFNKQNYDAWLNRLAEPWNEEDNWDSET